jgi:DNA repair exonuclease SbcCD ATPase subunit
MKTIKILEINLRNFKGARNVNIKFDERLTNIEGDNETGKTTIADAFNWVLFGKNSENKSDFSIKTLESGLALSKLEHEVTAKFDIDSVEYEFKRIYKEKYTKKKGSNEAVFDGHFEEWYINDVPSKTLTEYNTEIERLFQGSNFRLVTDPIYFNTQLKWEQRRAILMEIAGDITEQSIMDLHPELDQIPLIFAEGKTIEKKTDELNAKKRKIKEVMDGIPERLDEIERSIDTNIKSLFTLKVEKLKIETEIKEKESIITDSSKGTEKVQQEISALIEQKFEIQRQIKAIEEKHEADARTAKSNLNTRKDELEGDLKKLNSDIDDLNSDSIKKQNEIDALREENKKLRSEYDETLKTEIDKSAFNCPTCSAPISNEKIEALNTKFNLDKSTKLEQLKQKAVENNNSIASCQKIIEANGYTIGGLKKQINPKEIELEEIKSQIENFVIGFDASELNKLETKIPEIDKQIESLKQQPKEDLNTEVKQEIEALKVDLDLIKKDINKHEFNSQQIQRKNDLMQQNQTQIDELSKIELVENQIKLFIKYHISAIENFINTSFEGVEFKLFEQQVNGGEKPVCVCLVKGVPFPDANTAGQINSGLQIIKMLQKHFGLYAPIFIDNRERVTKIIPFDTQIINLRVVEGLKVLTVN